MTDIIIYTTEGCLYCQRAKALLDSKGVQYTEYRVDDSPELREEMESKSQRRSVPQIFINGQHVGGSDDLIALDDRGELDNLLK